MIRAVLVLAAFAGCFEPRFDEHPLCGPGNACPANLTCLSEACIELGCANHADDERCVTETIPDGVCRNALCIPRGCGDGFVDPTVTPPEVCDDGGNESGDGCSADCGSDESCGNGILDVDEQCDPAIAATASRCRSDCTSRLCGDDIVDPGEGCDDGAANSDAPDAPCRSDCQPRRCGDGIQDANEVCDDHDLVSGDGCSGDCLSNETCGNGYVDFLVLVPEQCDSGIPGGTAQCRANCTVPRCGDGILDAAESCDLAAQNSEAPDAACRTDCQPQRCGDGVVDTGEVCDDHDLISGNGCSGDCRSDESCGNGLVDLFAGEECDDGRLSGDGCSSGCGVETAAWQQLSVGAPPGRFFAAMAYDSARGCLVLFGGSINDTWELCGASWTRRFPATSPSARSTIMMAYDRVRRQTVLFGGTSGSAETWLWDGVNWTKAAPPTSPPGRSGAVLVYDAPRDRTVLFGGESGGAVLGDTWTWDGATWTQQQPLQSPPKTTQAGAAYDGAHGRVIMFGGIFVNAQNRTVDSDATWSWNGTTWTEVVTPTRPSPRRSPLAYDEANRRIVMFGGASGDTLSDTWDLDGDRWTQRGPVPAPPFRSAHVLAYSARLRATILFGGGGAGTLVDTWSLRPADADRVIESCTAATLDSDGDGAAGCADPDCWGRCAPACLPGEPCDPAAPHCGDGVCALDLEDTALCPADCP